MLLTNHVELTSYSSGQFYMVFSPYEKPPFPSTKRPTFFWPVRPLKKCRSVIRVDDKPRRIDILFFRSILHGFSPTKNYYSFQQKDLHFLTSTTTVKNVGLTSVLWTNHVELISSSYRQFYMVFSSLKIHISFIEKTYIFWPVRPL